MNDKYQCIEDKEFFKIREEFFPRDKEILINPNQPSLKESTLNVYDKRLKKSLKKRKRINKFILIPVMVFLLTIIFTDNRVYITTHQKIYQYVVQKGDTLWDISSEYLGSSLRYLQIVKENNIADPNLIYPNEVYWITVTKTTKYKNGKIIRETIH